MPIRRNRPRKRLILALALGVTVIHAGLLLSDEARYAYACELLVRGSCGLLAVSLMLLAWRLRKTAFSKAIVCSLASMLLLMCGDFFYEAYIFQALLFLLSPVCLLCLCKALQNRFHSGWAAVALALALWSAAVVGVSALFCLFSLCELHEIASVYPLLLAEAAVSLWLSLRRFGRAELLRWWVACLLVSFWILNGYRVYPLRLGCWSSFLETGLPFLLTLLLQFLKKELRSPRLSGAAFFLCSLIVFLCDLTNRHLAPSRELYYLLLPLIVYTIEGAEEQPGACPHILRAGYALLCGGLIFAFNERLRTVFYDLGFPAVGIPAQARVDWLSYRLAGLKSFLAGSAEPFEELSAYPGLGDPGGYLLSDEIGAAVFGHGWWWLAVMLALAALVSVLLLKTQWKSAALNRCKNVFAFSFLLRAAIKLPAALFMYSAAGVHFPFTLCSMMDLLWLWLLFEKNAACDVSGRGRPPAKPAFP